MLCLTVSEMWQDKSFSNDVFVSGMIKLCVRHFEILGLCATSFMNKIYLERQQLIRLTSYYINVREFRSLCFEITKSEISWLLLKELYLTLASKRFGCCLSCCKSLQHSSTLPNKHHFHKLPNYKLQLHQCQLLMHNVSLPGAIDHPLKYSMDVIN